MMDKEQILRLLEDYKQAIHTQDEAFFRSLWADDTDNALLSVTKDYHGTDAIVRDFLIGGIRAAYQEITLIADNEPVVRFLTDEIAVIIFRYHTECIRRETGEPYGIAGLETQIVRKTPDGWKLTHVHYSK